MTLKDKKNSREYNRKLKAGGGTSSNIAKEKEKKKESKKEKTGTGSDFAGETETAAKLIEDANKRFEKDESDSLDVTEKKYAKRNITSNWAKYEIPDEGEEEEEEGGEKTGPEFESVLASAQGAEAHFKFRCEQEWEKQAESIGDLSQEFFSLDISKLESEIMSVPFHQQIGLSEEELVPEFLHLISQKTEICKEGKLIMKEEVEKDLNQKVMNILSFTSVPTNNEEKIIMTDMEKVLPTDKSTSTFLGETSFEAPLEKRQDRRQRGLTKARDINKCDDSDDLKFIEDFGKESKSGESMASETSQQKEVVSVKITAGENKNLEDWLDDFLDE